MKISELPLMDRTFDPFVARDWRCTMQVASRGKGKWCGKDYRCTATASDPIVPCKAAERESLRQEPVGGPA